MSSPLADLVTAWMAEDPRKQLDVADLLRKATAADPSLVGDPSARTRIANTFRELAEAGVLVLPKSPAGWDDRTLPALPRWVRKRAVHLPASPERSGRVWPQPLAAAATVATRPDELDLLDRLANWLRNNPDPTPVPLEERALELFGDEKALTPYLTNRLFTSGALTLDLLACYRPPLLFPSQYVPGAGPTCLLVAENNATFQSLLTTARSLEPASRPDLHVGWGSGNQFPVSVPAVGLLAPPPQGVFYFGDLDVAGLRIAVSAAAAAATLGLPALRPAAPLYSWLLHHGTPRPDRSSRGNVDVDALLAWLPETLHTDVGRHLRNRERIPQETLGLRALRAEPDLLSAAVRGDG